MISNEKSTLLPPSKVFSRKFAHFRHSLTKFPSPLSRKAAEIFQKGVERMNFIRHESFGPVGYIPPPTFRHHYLWYTDSSCLPYTLLYSGMAHKIHYVNLTYLFRIYLIAIVYLTSFVSCSFELSILIFVTINTLRCLNICILCDIFCFCLCL